MTPGDVTNIEMTGGKNGAVYLDNGAGSKNGLPKKDGDTDSKGSKVKEEETKMVPFFEVVSSLE